MKLKFYVCDNTEENLDAVRADCIGYNIIFEGEFSSDNVRLFGVKDENKELLLSKNYDSAYIFVAHK